MTESSIYTKFIKENQEGNASFLLDLLFQDNILFTKLITQLPHHRGIRRSP